MNRPPLDWQDVAVQRERVLRDFSRSSGKIEMDLWAPLRGTCSRPSDRARSGLAAPRFDQAHELDALAWAPRAMGFTANIASGFAMALLLVGVAVWKGWL